MKILNNKINLKIITKIFSISIFYHFYYYNFNTIFASFGMERKWIDVVGVNMMIAVVIMGIITESFDKTTKKELAIIIVGWPILTLIIAFFIQYFSGVQNFYYTHLEHMTISYAAISIAYILGIFVMKFTSNQFSSKKS